MLDDYSYKRSHRIGNTFCFSTVTMVRRTRLNVRCSMCIACLVSFVRVCVCVCVVGRIQKGRLFRFATAHKQTMKNCVQRYWKMASVLYVLGTTVRCGENRFAPRPSKCYARVTISLSSRRVVQLIRHKRTMISISFVQYQEREW